MNIGKARGDDQRARTTMRKLNRPVNAGLHYQVKKLPLMKIFLISECVLNNTVRLQNKNGRRPAHVRITHHLWRVRHPLSIHIRMNIKKVMTRKGHSRHHRVRRHLTSLRHLPRPVKISGVPLRCLGL